MKKHLFTFLKVSVTLGLSLWLIFSLDWREVVTHLSGIRIEYIFLYILMQILGNIISSRKWQVIALYKNISFSLRDGFFTYITGAFINNFLPSTIGGDTYRAMWLAKRSGRRFASISTVVFDRFIGFWTLALLALILGYFLLPYLPTYLPGDFSLMTLSLLTFAAIALYFGLTFVYWQPWFQKLLLLIPSRRIRSLLEEIHSFSKRDIWFRASAWSALFAFVGIGLSNRFLFSSLGVEVPLLPYLACIFSIAIVISAPITINNIGVKEWAYAFFFTMIGIDFEVAVVASLLSRFIQTFISFIALPHYLSSREKEKSLREEALEPKEILS
ncbi:MAG: lysylphosphatidylglycerol synthase transmembrane domain-containing protein [Patescibacteria group bacterium]